MKLSYVKIGFLRDEIGKYRWWKGCEDVIYDNPDERDSKLSLASGIHTCIEDLLGWNDGLECSLRILKYILESDPLTSVEASEQEAGMKEAKEVLSKIIADWNLKFPTIAISFP